MGTIYYELDSILLLFYDQRTTHSHPCVCSKRSKTEREAESRTSEDIELTKTDSKVGLTATVLELDKGLLQHCKHVKSLIKPLTTIAKQVNELAR